MPKSTPTTPPLDREAKRRLAVIRHVEEVSGNVAMSCRYFGISRQAYYTWYRRYQTDGVEGLRTRFKAPKTSPNATHVEVVGKIIYLRQNYHFGPEKVAMYLKRYHDVTISKSGVRADSQSAGHGPPAGLPALQAPRPQMEAVREAAARPPGADRREVHPAARLDAQRIMRDSDKLRRVLTAEPAGAASAPAYLPGTPLDQPAMWAKGAPPPDRRLPG
ncbi:helix-turn-helix domain-containing protein [Streptomyces echinatus]|uniref:helix-turn-helix domain-containing protein n=1 Tax=Streptomyces echinatus TaxID=67293 RepID=UPI00381C656B